jgi:hypothetical protein
MRAISNMTNQLVICTLNSGKTLYLAPAETSEPIDPIEFAGNDKFDKLVAARLVSIVPVGKPRESHRSVPGPASDLVMQAPYGVEKQRFVSGTAAAPAPRQEGRIAIVTNARWDVVDAAASGA